MFLLESGPIAFVIKVIEREIRAQQVSAVAANWQLLERFWASAVSEATSTWAHGGGCGNGARSGDR